MKNLKQINEIDWNSENLNGARMVRVKQYDAVHQALRHCSGKQAKDFVWQNIVMLLAKHFTPSNGATNLLISIRSWEIKSYFEYQFGGQSQE
jgi:hypothetical protein